MTSAVSNRPGADEPAIDHAVAPRAVVDEARRQARCLSALVRKKLRTLIPVAGIGIAAVVDQRAEDAGDGRSPTAMLPNSAGASAISAAQPET